MYQPYPGGPGDTQAPEQFRPPIPQSVTRAVQFMYAGAAASLIGIIISLATIGSLKSEIQKRYPNYTTTQVNNAQHLAIGAAIVVGLITVGLWLWMAQMNKAGKGWARIVATVLFGISTLSTLSSLAAAGLAAGGVSRIYGIIVWLIGLGAIIFLYKGDSKEYFRQASAPRY
jgi:hypothetical protein